MKSFEAPTRSTLLAVLSLFAVAAAASSATAMPVAAPAGEAPVLRRVADQHRVYPGSESTAAQKAREDRNAPNRFCEKQQQYCE